MTTDNDKAPEWMTEDWLATMARTPGDNQPLAREILRLRAELAKVTAFIASLPNLKEAGEMCKQAAAELATLTAELATLKAHADHDAGEILRLGGELAERTRERDEIGRRRDDANAALREAGRDRQACVARIGQLEAERDAARAEMGSHNALLRDVCREIGPGVTVDSLLATIGGAMRAAKGALSDRDHYRAESSTWCADVVKVRLELEKAIRAKYEFAAREVERFYRDCFDESGPLYTTPVRDSVKIRAAELRKAAPSTEGQSSILPLVRADGRTLRVGAIAGGAHPDDRRDGFPAELRLELGDVSRRHSCRYVRQAEGVSEGVSAGVSEGGKAAGAAAPAEPNLLDKLHAAYRAHDEAVARLQSRRATPAADAAAPVEFATTSTPGAFAFLANEPDVYATPAADARQPAGDSTRCRMIAQTIIAAIGSAGPENVEQSVDRLLRHLSETEKREADGIKLFDDLLATERAKVATMTIELDGMRNRIAASEKAKADQVVLVMNLRRALGMVRAKVGRVLGPQWEDNGHVGQVIRAAVELCDAPERAGGAS